MDIKNFGFSVLRVNDEETIAKIAELNQLLEPMGVVFDLTPYEETENKDSSSVGYMGIRIDIDTLEKKKTRNAGRKKDYSKGKKYNMRPSVGDVFEWRKTMTHQQIIEKIGCPRATYYRRIKELSEDYGISDTDTLDEASKRLYFL